MSLSQRDFAVVRTLRRNEEASFVISAFPGPSYFFFDTMYGKNSQMMKVDISINYGEQLSHRSASRLLSADDRADH
jgi:hypothetical protein